MDNQIKKNPPPTFFNKIVMQKNEKHTTFILFSYQK